MKTRKTYPRGDSPAAAPRASKCVISWSKVCPAVSKSANFCPGLHQLGGSRRPGFTLYVFDSRFLAVSAAVKKSGHTRIWATAGRARGVESVMARLFVVDFSGRRQKKGDGKKIIAGGMDDSVERMDDGKKKCWVG